MASLAVHRLNEFHKDIKPSNILISGAKFLLADFGLTEPRDVPDDEEIKSRGVMGPIWHRRVRVLSKTISRVRGPQALVTYGLSDG